MKTKEQFITANPLLAKIFTSEKDKEILYLCYCTGYMESTMETVLKKNQRKQTESLPETTANTL